VPVVDGDLKALAEVGLALTAAEEALDDAASQAAVARLDEAEAGLAGLRTAWPGMSPARRRLVGATAAPLRARLDAARARVPRRRALAEIAPEPDPEQERDPAEAR
jgi:hypothetical protein